MYVGDGVGASVGGGCVGDDVVGTGVGDGVGAGARTNSTVVSVCEAPSSDVTTTVAVLVTPTLSDGLLHVLPAVYGPPFTVMVASVDAGTATSATPVTECPSAHTAPSHAASVVMEYIKMPASNVGDT